MGPKSMKKWFEIRKRLIIKNDRDCRSVWWAL